MLSVTNKPLILSVIVLNVVMLSVTNRPLYCVLLCWMSLCWVSQIGPYTVCYCAECRYAECHGAVQYCLFVTNTLAYSLSFWNGPKSVTASSLGVTEMLRQGYLLCCGLGLFDLGLCNSCFCFGNDVTGFWCDVTGLWCDATRRGDRCLFDRFRIFVTHFCDLNDWGGCLQVSYGFRYRYGSVRFIGIGATEMFKDAKKRQRKKNFCVFFLSKKTF